MGVMGEWYEEKRAGLSGREEDIKRLAIATHDLALAGGKADCSAVWIAIEWKIQK